MQTAAEAPGTNECTPSLHTLHAHLGSHGLHSLWRSACCAIFLLSSWLLWFCKNVHQVLSCRQTCMESK
jgi:hypothetical protein